MNIAAYDPPLGTSVDDLDTPCLVLDLDVMEANIRAIAAACAKRGVAWRPHAKGHKSSTIAKAEVAAGALGATCAKLGEAEVLGAGGVRDLLIANMLAGPHKVRRLVELRKIADPIVAVDSLDQVAPIGRAMAEAGLVLRVIIEVDIGLNRVGTQPGEPTLALARDIMKVPGVAFAGIMGYEGHLLTLDDPAEKLQKINAALDILSETKRQLQSEGIPCPIVSCAGTGSFLISIEHPDVTEVQAGGAIFMDHFYRHKCRVPDLQYALTVPVTIVSRPTPSRAIIDAGRKTLNVEVCTPEVLGRDDIAVKRLSAEHGELELAPSAQNLKVGDRLTIVPGYADLTVALHDKFYCVRGGKLVDIWPVEARGRVS
ncbi:MAG: DSD1 family PLP-dependent enzyme [Planctomycetaceae bacterium]|nr:DSD1 family PLP-dependent enzyme [Planctomycetaceae bacterium]